MLIFTQLCQWQPQSRRNTKNIFHHTLNCLRIAIAINLLEQIDKYYDADVAKDLQNRLINSIRGRDSTKFERGIRKVIKESRVAGDENQ